MKKKTFKDYLKDLRLYVAVIVIVLGFLAYMGDFFSLPTKVEALAAEDESIKGTVHKLSKSVDKYFAIQQQYMAVQEERDKNNDEYKDLMTEIVLDMRKRDVDR